MQSDYSNLDKSSEGRGIPQEKGFDTSKNTKKASTFGRNVRLKTGKDGQEYVKLDSNLGKAVREALVTTGLRKPEDIRYVKDLSEKVKILNSLEFKNPDDSKIAKILAKEIVKDEKFYKSSKPTSLDFFADSYITIEQGKLYEKLKKVPMIDAMLSEYYSGLNEESFTTHEALANLESRGVDLKKGKLDGEKFVDNLVKKKYNELPAFHKDLSNKDLTYEIKGALRDEISKRYQNALLLESLVDSKKDIVEVNKLCRNILKDDYRSVLTGIEEYHKVIVDQQVKNIEIIKEKVPLFLQISGRLPGVNFEGGSEKYNDFLMYRHYFNELNKFGVDLEHAEFDKNKFIAKLAEDKIEKNPKLYPDRLSAEMSKRYASIEALINFADEDRKISSGDKDERILNDKIRHLFDDDYTDFEKKVGFR